MVSHKRLDFGFNGYQVPANARAPRSARKRRLFEKKYGEDKMCAFDLLATVAGNLLLENESPMTSSNRSIHGDEDKCVVVQNTVKNEFLDEEKPVKAETCCGDNRYKESSSPCDDFQCGFTSVITNPDHSSEFDTQKLVNEKTRNEAEGFANSTHSESRDVGNSDLDFKPAMDSDTVILDAKPDVLVSVGSSSTEQLVCRDNVPHSSRDDVNLVIRDDDEKFSRHIHSCWTKKSCRPVPRIGDRRIRKILASRYWKGGPKTADVKPWYCAKRNHYFHHQRNYPIKKRKYFGHFSESNSDGSSKGNGCFKGDDYHSRPKMRRASGKISSVNGQHTSFVSRDSHVRLRIKSFRVPELFIEIPETATVGSLKRTVMEAVTAILGGGLRVGLMLKGKKVRDDNKTLLQTGISQDNNIHLDSLGFCLEPSSSKSPQPVCAEASPCALPCDTPQPLTRYPTIRAISHQHACDGLTECHAANVGNLLESDHDSAPSLTDSSSEKGATDDSRALVPVVALSPGPLAVVAPPPSRKPKRVEQQQAAQRRIRRPFSVAEVEALVQAVEKLGTGRWRDVKLRAFDDANHRTYVDLKDKWKTLVHTARISPQQRRGEPVPQELLDRVLAAHAYWSEQQPRQPNVKQTQPQPQPPSQPDTLLLL